MWCSPMSRNSCSEVKKTRRRLIQQFNRVVRFHWGGAGWQFIQGRNNGEGGAQEAEASTLCLVSALDDNPSATTGSAWWLIKAASVLLFAAEGEERQICLRGGRGARRLPLRQSAAAGTKATGGSARGVKALSKSRRRLCSRCNYFSAICRPHGLNLSFLVSILPIS